MLPTRNAVSCQSGGLSSARLACISSMYLIHGTKTWNEAKFFALEFQKGDSRTYVSRHVPSQDLVGQAVDKLQLYIPCFYFSTCVDFTSTAARASLCCQRLNKAKMGTAPSTH